MVGNRRPDGTPVDQLKPGDYCKINRRQPIGTATNDKGPATKDAPPPVTVDRSGEPQWWAVCPPIWRWPAGWRDDQKTETRGWPGLLNPAVHTVVEHEDRTITVVPSIVQTIAGGSGCPDQQVFHGFLERGVWREC